MRSAQWQHVTEQLGNINNKILPCFLYCSLLLLFLAPCYKRWVSGLLALVHTLSFSLPVFLCLLTGVRRILNIEATRQLASTISKHWFSISLNQLGSRRVFLLNVYRLIQLQAFFKIINKPRAWKVLQASMSQKVVAVMNGSCDGKQRKMLFKDLPDFSSLVNGAISH